MLCLIANYATIVSRGTIVKNSTSLNAIWKVLHLYYGIQSIDDTGHPFHSETPHQSYIPPDQEYAMCKPAEKPDCDFHCIPRDDKPLLKRSKSVAQSCTDDSRISHSNDESNLEDISMNMDSVPALSDHENSLPDSTILPTESMQSCSSVWKSTVLPPQTIVSLKSSC